MRRLSQQLILVSVHFKLSESTVHQAGVHLKDSGHTLLDNSPSTTIASLDNTLRRRIREAIKMRCQDLTLEYPSTSKPQFEVDMRTCSHFKLYLGESSRKAVFLTSYPRICVTTLKCS